MLRAFDDVDLEFVQSAFRVLAKERKLIYVLHANEDGDLLNHISDEDCSLVDWVLVDSAKMGRYSGFDVWTLCGSCILCNVVSDVV
ncbi:Aldolase-type TIM barrel [Artemisia annua]|uniref:Aldolase-type TIM barrel n=1 Tax=Artemisia annua TaxID=35608 RepID=A0A2U1M9T1_ARTAN|nr:Aldolase-type TIM barrel [Artemisia annua]